MKRRQASDDIKVPAVILRDMLTRLAAKSLVRFRCVSKPWSSLIRSPLFVELHSTRSKTRPGGSRLVISVQLFDHYFPSDTYACFLFANQQGKPSPHQPPLCFPKYVRVSAVVNGLVCLQQVVDSGHASRVCVCNLSTHEIINLPVYQKCYYLFGCDALGKEYIVLRQKQPFLKWCDVLGKYKYNNCELLTLNTLSWERINGVCHEFPEHNTNSICVNGHIYWLSAERTLVGFDVTKKVFRVIPPPDSAFTHPIQVGGCLALVNVHVHVLTPGTTTINLSILEDCHNHTWIKETIILTQNVPTTFPPPAGSIGIREIILVGTSFSLPMMRLQYYDPYTRQVREIQVTLLPDSNHLVGFQEWTRFIINTYTPIVEGYQNSLRISVSNHVENIMPLGDEVNHIKKIVSLKRPRKYYNLRSGGFVSL